MTESPLPPPIPRMLEVFIMKAAVDAPFKEDLIALRSKIADRIDMKLTPQEKAILDAMPESHLRTIIARLTVPEEKVGILRSLFTPGGGLFEGALIAGLVGMVGVAAMTASGGSISTLFNSVSTQLELAGALRNVTVSRDFQDTPFAEAIEALEKETGFRISLITPPGFNSRVPVSSLTQGNRLESALLVLSTQAAASAFKVTLELRGPKEVTLRFSTLDQTGTTNPGASAPASQ